MKKRNVLKTLSLALFIFILSFSLISCGKKKDKEKEDGIVEEATQDLLDSKGKFAKGLRVLGIDIGEMNASEATLSLADSVQRYSNAQNIIINIPGQASLNLPAYSMGVGIDLTRTLNNALVLSNDDFVKSQIESAGFYEAPILHNLDGNMLRTVLNEQAASLASEPVEPTVSFSPDNPGDKFSFTEGTPGISVDIESLYTMIETAANSGASPIEVTAAVEQVQPTQNIADLQKNISKIVTFSTKYTGSEERVHNLVLGTSKINNKTLRPGENFSFNDIVGPRDAKNGWKEAATIVGGSRYENDFGGGICQISTTLYNAVLKSDLKIVKRSKHSIPSNYIEHGLDATVSWGGYDFVFQNNTDYPIYVFSNVNKSEQKVYVTIYGRPVPNGETIILRSKQLSSVDPKEPEIMEDETLAKGQTAWAVDARKGFEVQAYKEYVKDGVVVRTENLTIDNYSAVDGVKRVGVGAGGSSSGSNGVSVPSEDNFQDFNTDSGSNSNSGTDNSNPFELPPETTPDDGGDVDSGSIDLPSVGEGDGGENSGDGETLFE